MNKLTVYFMHYSSFIEKGKFHAEVACVSLNFTST